MAKDKVTLDVEAGGAKQQVETAAVLMAAGRAVNTENIGFKECGIQLTERGFIKVDRNLQTTAAGLLRHRRRGRPADARPQGEPRRRRTWRS